MNGFKLPNLNFYQNFPIAISHLKGVRTKIYEIVTDMDRRNNFALEKQGFAIDVIDLAVRVSAVVVYVCKYENKIN